MAASEGRYLYVSMDHLFAVEVLQDLPDLSHEEFLHVHAQPFEVVQQELPQVTIPACFEGQQQKLLALVGGVVLHADNPAVLELLQYHARPGNAVYLVGLRQLADVVQLHGVHLLPCIVPPVLSLILRVRATDPKLPFPSTRTTS